MPIIGFLMMVAMGAAIWYWRLKMLREAGSEVIDSVERMRGAFKRRQFRKKVEAAPLATIQDPAIAAVTLFMCLVGEKPMYKEAAKDLVRQRMKAIIRASDMEEILIFADWTARNVISPEDPARRFRNLWMAALNADERAELVSIAEDVAAIGGDLTVEQENALQTLRRGLLNQS